MRHLVPTILKKETFFYNKIRQANTTALKSLSSTLKTIIDIRNYRYLFLMIFIYRFDCIELSGKFVPTNLYNLIKVY